MSSILERLNPSSKSFDPSLIETRLFIGGKWVESEETIQLQDPSTFKDTVKVHAATAEHVEQAVVAAEKALPVWQAMPGYARSAILARWAQLYVENWEECAALDAVTMGQPIELFRNLQLPYAAGGMHYYAGILPMTQGTTSLHTPGQINMTLREPYGVTAGIIPWNVPCIMFTMKAFPALAAGNCHILKSSEKAPLSALKLAALAKEAGVPDGVLSVISGYGKPSGQALAEHPRIRKIAFTGSTRTGKLIAQMAAGSNLKSCSLELGGKSPLLIFADADLDLAVSKAVRSIAINSGQICMASSRIYVESSIRDRFVEAFKKEFTTAASGHPFGAKALGGPQADKIQFEAVLKHIEDGKKSGQLALGGERSGDLGAFIKPTIFTDVDEQSSIARNEVSGTHSSFRFGPVVVVNTFETEEEALRKANDTEHGLYASVFTRDINRALRCARTFEAGTVAVNDTSPTLAYDLPMGGYKSSGSGREMGLEGLQAYTELKTVMISVEGLGSVQTQVDGH